MSRPLKASQNHRYVLLEIVADGANELDEVTVRKIFQDALAQSFGLSCSGTYMDILYFSLINEEGNINSNTNGDAKANTNAYHVIVRVNDGLVLYSV